MIRLSGLSKTFGQRVAVDDLTLHVRAGEIFGLLGHNGAGKSTAIGTMLGQVWPTQGEVLICGHDVTRHRQLALQKVGAIFETPVFYDYLSGWRNLEILSHYTAPTPPERIREVVEWVGLTGRETSKVKTYSHGMRARLALAQALLPQPELLILDEPGDGLDPEGIHEMRQTIRRLHRELGLTIFLSSHLLSEVEQLCTRIAVMNQGRKVFEGSLAEVKQPKNWVRLRVNDFHQAVKSLREKNLIVDERDGQFVALASEVDTDVVVRRLVEQGMAVYEIARHEQTLEDFYLGLMRDDSDR
ncbi:MAG: ABC transporter ATP-binding protein [Verrucomicrobia bacterium]|nr:MAG: ABC transporter ATP-binding protein [Verrucomicrobiota bacterium]PYJ96251.1 MAG: ABC transporter ATP-binding protein [Verrucomicrobiota bacterium]